MDRQNDEVRLKIYEMIVERYKEMINSEEEQSVSEIRQKITPYDDYVKALRDRLIEDLQPYDFEKHFFLAVQKTMEYMKKIETVNLGFSFWLGFDKIEDLKVSGPMEKAILLASLLRSLDSRDAKVVVGKSGRIFVGFSAMQENYLIVLESGSLLAGPDVSKAIEEDPMAYAFSDLFYDNYEES